METFFVIAVVGDCLFILTTVGAVLSNVTELPFVVEVSVALSLPEAPL